MKIGKYISELLFENDFVILPQMGEFSTKYIPARFVPELKKVESPSKVVTFNDKNKSGGGLLTEYIARKEGVSSAEARTFVDNFVAEMHNSLNAGKKVELESIGVFSVDPTGALLFEPDKSINYLNDTTGLSSVNEPEKKTEEEAKSELDRIVEQAAPAPSPIREFKASDADSPYASRTKPVVQAAGEEKKSEPIKPTVPIGQRTPVSSNRQVSDSGSSKATPQKTGLPPALKWVALTVVPAIVIIIILALNYEYLLGDKAVFGRKAKVTPQPSQVEQPVVQQQEQLTPAPVVQETFDPTVQPPAPERGRKVFFIIVGSFEEEHSAIILAEELRSKGARTAYVFPIRNGFYRVAYGYYYELTEAERELDRAKAVNPNAWILHR